MGTSISEDLWERGIKTQAPEHFPEKNLSSNSVGFLAAKSQPRPPAEAMRKHEASFGRSRKYVCSKPKRWRTVVKLPLEAKSWNKNYTGSVSSWASVMRAWSWPRDAGGNSKDILRDCHVTADSDHVKTQESQDNLQGTVISAHLFFGLNT